MKLFTATILIALIVPWRSDAGVESGNGNLQQALVDLFPKQTADEALEEELLGVYLRENPGRGRRGFERSYAELRNQRRIRSLYHKEWLRQLRKKDEIRNYWKLYFEGIDYALEVAPTPDKDNCTKLTRIVDLGWYPFGDDRIDPLYREAFFRGIIAARSECFLTDIVGPIEEIEKELLVLRGKLVEIQRNLLLNKPREKDLAKIRKDLEGLMSAKYSDLLKQYIPKLKITMAPAGEEWTNIQELVKLIADTIDCSNLRNRRTSQKYSCSITRVSPKEEIDFAAAYRLLVKGIGLSRYQETILMDSFFDAVAYFQTEVEPNNAVVANWIKSIRTNLKNMDGVATVRLANLKKNFEDDKRQMILDFSYDHSQYDHNFFKKEDRIRFITYFYDLKDRIEALFRRPSYMEEGREIARRLDRLRSDYQHTLSLSGNIALLLKLGTEPIKVDLDQDLFEKEALGVHLPQIDGGYLLGNNRSEVDEWLRELQLRYR